MNLASIPQGYLGEALFSRGFFAELRGSHNVFGSDSDFLQLRVQTERVFDLSARWHLLLRGDIGASLVAQFSELPGSVRFFAGGDRSVRGFGYNELSPTETVTVARIERRQPRHADHQGRRQASADGHRGARARPAAQSGPGGVRRRRQCLRQLRRPARIFRRHRYPLRLPVVTMGIDIAQPLSEPGASPRLHINFSPKL